MLESLLYLLLTWYGGSLLISSTCPCGRLPFVQKKAELPEDMRASIREIEADSKDKLDFLQKSYSFLAKRFKGYWFPFFLNPASLFWKDLKHIWNYKGVLVCLNLNYISAQFLIHSKFFSERDVSMDWKFLRGFSYHKYLVVNVDGKKIDYDLWRGNLRL